MIRFLTKFVGEGFENEVLVGDEGESGFGRMRVIDHLVTYVDYGVVPPHFGTARAGPASNNSRQHYVVLLVSMEGQLTSSEVRYYVA
jgi:hypothetical protein